MARTHENLAPWAEPALDAPYPMSLEEFERLPDDARRQELVEGRLVRMAPPGGGHGSLTMNLSLPLALHVRQHGLGQVLAAETGFTLSEPGSPEPTVLAPDIAFVRADRLPARESPDWDRLWRLAPDLVVEVPSHGQTRHELAAKARLWLRHGVRLVWVVWSSRRQVDVWRPGADEPVQTLRIGDVLDGGDVVPGFTYPLGDLFA